MATPTFWLSHDNEAQSNSLLINGSAVVPVTSDTLMIDGEKSTVYRFTLLDSGDQRVGVTWPDPVKIGVVALLKTNLQLGDSVRFIVNGLTTGDVLYDQTVQLTNDPALGFDADFVFVLPQDVESIRVLAVFEFGDSPSLAPFTEVGELWCGPCFRPEHGISYEVTPVLADPSEVAYSRGQQAIANTRARFRALNLQFPALKESEVFGTYGSDAANLWDIFQRNGRTRKVLTGLVGDGDTFTAARNYLVNRTALFGLMDADLQPQPFDASAGERLYSLSLAVRETR